MHSLFNEFFPCNLKHYFTLFLKNFFSLSFYSTQQIKSTSYRNLFLVEFIFCFSVSEISLPALRFFNTHRAAFFADQISSPLHKIVIDYDYDYFQFMKDDYDYIFNFEREIAIMLLIIHFF